MMMNNQKNDSYPEGAEINVKPVTWQDGKVMMYQCIITIPQETGNRLVTGEPCSSEDSALDSMARELYERMMDTRTGLSAVRDYLNGETRLKGDNDSEEEEEDGEKWVKVSGKKCKKPRVELRPEAWCDGIPTEYKAFVTVYRDAKTSRVYNGDACSTKEGALIALKKELHTVNDTVCAAMKVLDNSF